ncbi:MAG: toprim domain-containing protein [Methylococcaceae bacterium]
MNFNQDLINKIRNRLQDDNSKYRISGEYINGLKCPACNKVDGFAHTDNPMAILCHRNNECGINTPIKEVYPDLWSDLTKDYPPTPLNPTATARAYLESRGLNANLIEFRQGTVYDRDTKKEYQSLVIEQGGVKFDRLIDYSGKDKNRLSGYKGKVFETVGALNPECETVFVTEGIINALSLEQCGFPAIATYSSGSIPKEWFELNQHRQFVLAFDSDTAGIKGIQKTIDYFKDLGVTHYKIALTPRGKDWNDLLVGNQLNEKTIEKSYWQGRLAFAKSALDYFAIYLDHYTHANTLIFEFEGETFKGYLAERKEGGETVYEPKVKRLADCTIRLLHSVIDDSLDDKQRIEHYIELESTREGKGRVRLDATELTALASFKITLQNHRQLFYGNADDLTNVASYLFNQKPKPPKIRALSTIGYDAKSNGFYFPKFMYDVDGKRIDANGDKYFQAANIKPFMSCSDTVISRIDDIDLTQFITDLHGAYGNKGLMALGFYVSSLFSRDIFNHYGFFPFLSLYGAPHAGKSFVSRLLNRCLFVDSEGQTMTATNTAKGELRKISQKSSLVCALLEGRKDKSRFDYDSILPLYNRNALYSRATTSQDNRTHDLALNAAISFVWNHECFTLKPAKERVISLHFADSDLTEATGKAWVQLNNYSPEQLAGVGHYLLSNRKYFENNLISNAKYAANDLKIKGITVTRIAENHAIALSGINTLLELLNVQSVAGVDDVFNSLTAYAVERAKDKLETAKTESHIADYFFESIADLTTTDGVATNASNELVIHLPKVLAHLQQHNNGFTNKSELISELKRHDRYVGVKKSRCFSNPLDCYHFKK